MLLKYYQSPFSKGDFFYLKMDKQAIPKSSIERR